MLDTLSPVVTATKLTGHSRMCAIPRYFSAYMGAVEPAIYSVMGEWCENYTGAYWHFFKLSNGGFFMAPELKEPIELINAQNYASEKVSQEAAGIALCLVAYNRLVWKYRDPVFDSAFHKLREYALAHREMESIFRLID